MSGPVKKKLIIVKDVLLKVLQRNSYQLTEEDYIVIKSIYKNRDAFPEQKETICDAANSLE